MYANKIAGPTITAPTDNKKKKKREEKLRKYVANVNKVWEKWKKGTLICLVGIEGYAYGFGVKKKKMRIYTIYVGVEFFWSFPKIFTPVDAMG